MGLGNGRRGLVGHWRGQPLRGQRHRPPDHHRCRHHHLRRPHGVSATAVDLRGELAWSRTASAGALYASVVPRRVDANNDYRCKVVVSSSGAMKLSLVRRVGGGETNLTSQTVAGLTQAANQEYAFACRVVPSGTGTQVTGKLWRVGTTEPTGWQVTATDSAAALQNPGSVGVSAYLSSAATAGMTFSVDDPVATDPTG